tara:strand:- start:10281 stop:12464 length:2184 start_codon:yes stop_codon:yes gene_type:complete
MNKKIIATLGPSSFKKDIVKQMDKYGVEYFRINLSHTEPKDFAPLVKKISKWTNKKICPDTEGSQLRIGKIKNDYKTLYTNDEYYIYSKKKYKKLIKDDLSFNIDNPGDVLKVGDILNIDFNGVSVQVIEIINKEKIKVRTLIGGAIASNKGIAVDREINLPTFSKKDLKILSIAAKLKLKNIFLSFCSSSNDVKLLRKKFNYPIEIISKIESTKGLKNLSSICRESDSILIDRGDLSRDVQLEKIPHAQRYILSIANKNKTKTFIATNLMESMIENKQPTRAELNDIYGALESGANGLVLAAETAVGKYPDDAVRILSNIIYEFNNKNKSMNLSSILKFSTPLIIEPHGKTLINNYKDHSFLEELNNPQSLYIDEKTISDVFQICNGVYSPLDKFMDIAEIKSVIEKNKLKNGISWTLPILFQIHSEQKKNIPTKGYVLLKNKKTKKLIAYFKIEKIEKLSNLEKYFFKWFGTKDPNHPGYADVLKKGNFIVSGTPYLVSENNSILSKYELTPNQTRRIFHLKGWSKIIGFHTRNIPHSGHEYIQKKAYENINADCLFISPVIGDKKRGDFSSEIILRTYEKLLLSKSYLEYQSFLSGFNTYSRYAGPREAVFTALCRKNFGCSHFIIGRDHTGLKNFYKPTASIELFDKVETGLKIIPFEEIVYDSKKKIFSEKLKSNKNIYKISATQIRENILSGNFKKNYLTSTVVYKELKEAIIKSHKLFVE